MLEKVLCIDDDQITLVLCDMVIKKAGFAGQVITTNNGKEGLGWFSDFFLVGAILEVWIDPLSKHWKLRLS